MRWFWSFWHFHRLVPCACDVHIRLLAPASICQRLERRLCSRPDPLPLHLEYKSDVKIMWTGWWILRTLFFFKEASRNALKGLVCFHGWCSPTGSACRDWGWLIWSHCYLFTTDLHISRHRLGSIFFASESARPICSRVKVSRNCCSSVSPRVKKYILMRDVSGGKLVIILFLRHYHPQSWRTCFLSMEVWLKCVLMIYNAIWYNPFSF